MMRTTATVAASFFTSAALAQLQVVSTQPPLNAINIDPGSPISVTFDRPVNPATFIPSEFHVFARWSGPMPGALAYTNANQTVTWTPASPFAAGEAVMLVMSHDLRAADGTFLRQAGYTLTFTTRTRRTRGVFNHLTTISDRDNTGAQTRIYGGLACDLNRDGWADLTMINEVSADLRVFLNRADGSGLFGPMLTPYTPIPFESSPNEPADFNGDGFVDLVTSSNATNEICFAFGNGDGTFDPPTIIGVGTYPRGIGVVDADGDGDMDVTVSTTVSDSISLLTNTGAGVFSAPANFSALGDGPYGISAAEMNNDGILDLVVGYLNSNTVAVFRGNGNGTFTQVSSRSIGGSNWVIATGDLNGDGNTDVTGANSQSSNGSVLLGNGNGTLQPVTVHAVGGHCVATDLADIDGDGDQDWLLSSYGAGRWYLYRNNGAGAFTFLREFIAPSNPACSLFADFDNDGDADLALLDEIADVIVLMENICSADFDGDGDTGTDDDIEAFFACLGGDCCPTCLTADFDADGDTGTDADIEAFFRVLGGGAC